MTILVPQGGVGEHDLIVLHPFKASGTPRKSNYTAEDVELPQQIIRCDQHVRNSECRGLFLAPGNPQASYQAREHKGTMGPPPRPMSPRADGLIGADRAHKAKGPMGPCRPRRDGGKRQQNEKNTTDIRRI